MSSSNSENAAPNTKSGDVQLYLEAIVNGRSKDLIVELIQGSDGRFRISASELNAIGIASGQSGADGEWIYLDALEGVNFNFDPNLQTMHFTLRPEQAVLSNFDLRGSIDSAPVLEPSTGFMLNYVVTGQASSETSKLDPQFNGASVLLDGRLFSSIGSFSQSALVSTNGKEDPFSFRRLESFWTKSDPDKQLTYTVGDLITGGLSWTSPIRLGGLSLRRNFSTRPDLVTRPLPSFSGTALVPSTVDVFLGDLRLSSIDVDVGPYSLNNIDVPNRNGDLRFAVRDASGNIREETLSFSGSQAQLRKGLFDFSIDAGIARKGYGTQGDSYDTDLVGVGNLRYGLNDSVTLEVHGEAGAGLVNAGAGFSTSLPKIGSINLAVAGSNYSSLRGAQVSMGYSYNTERYSIQAETRRIFSDFLDLADITADKLYASGASERTTALDRIQFNSRFWDSKANVGLGYSHIERSDNEHTHILNASLGYNFSPQARFSLDGYTTIGSSKNSRIQAGLHISLSEDTYLSTGASYEDGEYGASSAIGKAAKQEPDSWSYGINLRKTSDNIKIDARTSHIGKNTRSTAILSGSGDSVGLYGSVEGSAAFVDGEVRFLQKIDDSFVVVDAGAPGVRVYRENQLVGHTDKNGKLFVPGVRSYERNKISIDPTDLPLESSISQTTHQISLPEKSGTVIRFSNQAKGSKSGTIIFVDNKGAYLPVGSTGRSLTTGEEFLIGYDGEAYFENLKSENMVEIDLGLSSCGTKFQLGTQASVVCNTR